VNWEGVGTNRSFYLPLLARWFVAEIIFSTLKMEAICSSETPVDTQCPGILEVLSQHSSGGTEKNNEKH
jgi:hypothetical protein